MYGIYLVFEAPQVHLIKEDLVRDKDKRTFSSQRRHGITPEKSTETREHDRDAKIVRNCYYVE